MYVTKMYQIKNNIILLHHPSSLLFLYMPVSLSHGMHRRHKPRHGLWSRKRQIQHIPFEIMFTFLVQVVLSTMIGAKHAFSSQICFSHVHSQVPTCRSFLQKSLALQALHSLSPHNTVCLLSSPAHSQAPSSTISSSLAPWLLLALAGMLLAACGSRTYSF